MKKKIIFILCTIVILCVGSFVNAATSFKDVDAEYEESVNTLVTLGLVNGYPEDNTYRPDNIVTRAEMAKLMVIALGEEEKVASAQNGTAKFKDVKSTDWEYGYVNLAAELGIINGYPDGTFGSKNTVSYAEATTMMIRALEYEDEVAKSTEIWPNNYITQAKKLSLFDSMSAVNATDGAKRGNIAILLWNMLRTGVCTPIGQNNNGLIYGEGEKMINKKMSNFIYLENALVTDVDFDDDLEEADVEFKGDKTITVTFDAVEAAQMYGQRFDVLYNTSKKEIEQVIESEDNNVKEGEIEKLTSSKIYIDGASSNGYELPDDDNILLYGIDDLDDAVSAILVFDGSKVEYVIAFPPEKIYLALVTATEVTVSDEEGIRVVNYKSSSSKAYALEDEDDMPEKDDIILYYLNSDDELIILDSTNVFESKTITSASNSKIKFGDKTYTFADTLYQIAEVKSSSLVSMSVSDIEDDEDSAVLMEFAGERYFVIFVGGVEEAEEALEDDIESAVKTLSTYMNKSATQNVKKNEIKYTQSTFATFMTAYENAETAIAAANKTANTTNLNKVNTAYADLQEAYKGLKLITSLSSSSQSTEKEKVELKVAIRKIVNGDTTVDGKKVTTCVTNKANYTTASYNKFNTALTAAKTQLAKTNATKNNLEKVKGDLESAIKGLVLKTEDTARVNALEDLNKAIKSAEAIGKTNNGYTEDTFTNFIECWDEAKALQTSTDVDAIKEATDKLNRAIRMLDEKIDVIIALLNEKIDEAAAYEGKSGDYFDEEYNAFTAALKLARAEKVSGDATYDSLNTKLKNLDTAIENLKKANIQKVLDGLKAEAKANYTLPSIVALANATNDEGTRKKKLDKIAALEKAMEEETEAIAGLRKALKAKIAEAEAVTSAAEWKIIGYTGSYDDMKKALDDANDCDKDPEANSYDLRIVLNGLSNALKIETTN